MKTPESVLDYISLSILFILYLSGKGITDFN